MDVTCMLHLQYTTDSAAVNPLGLPSSGRLWCLQFGRTQVCARAAADAEGDGFDRTPLEAIAAQDAIGGPGSGVGPAVAGVFVAATTFGAVAAKPEEADAIRDGQQGPQRAEGEAPETSEHEREHNVAHSLWGLPYASVCYPDVVTRSDK